MSPAKMVAQLLDALGETGGVSGWTGFYGTLPDKTPDKVVAVFDDEPQIDGRPTRPPYTVWVHPRIQIIVRSVTYDDGWDKISAVLLRLSQTVGHTEPSITGSPKFAGFYRKSGPAPMNRREEPNVRRLFVANLTFALEE